MTQTTLPFKALNSLKVLNLQSFNPKKIHTHHVCHGTLPAGWVPSLITSLRSRGYMFRRLRIKPQGAHESSHLWIAGGWVGVCLRRSWDIETLPRISPEQGALLPQTTRPLRFSCLLDPKEALRLTGFGSTFRPRAWTSGSKGRCCQRLSGTDERPESRSGPV